MDCPECGQPMHHYEQPSFLPDRPACQLAECQQEDCDYRYVTLSPGQHERMTPVQRAGYLKVGKAQRARLAAFKVQEDLELEAVFAAAGLNRKEFWGDPSEWHR